MARERLVGVRARLGVLVTAYMRGCSEPWDIHALRAPLGLNRRDVMVRAGGLHLEIWSSQAARYPPVQGE